MLKLKEITKAEIPEKVWNRIASIEVRDEFIGFYESDGMFGSEPDYLLVLEITDRGFYGFVYNGNEPDFSEFGSFGVDKQRLIRTW